MTVLLESIDRFIVNVLVQVIVYYKLELQFFIKTIRGIIQVTGSKPMGHLGQCL